MKKLFAVLLALSVMLGTAACGSSSAEAQPEAASASADAAAPYHLKIAYSPSLCNAPLHIAVEKGFFAAEGIDAENIQVDAAHVQEAIGAGQVDVGFGLIAKFLQPIENGLPIQFTAGIHTGCVKVVTRADSGITSMADLKGKIIGVPGLAGAEAIIAKRGLYAEGISVDEKNAEVQLAVYERADLAQALQNGSIDAISLSDPTVSQMVNEYGLTVLLDTAATEPYADEYCCACFVTDDLAQNHPDIAAAFTRAVLKAAVWVNEHPEEAAQIQLDANYVTGELDFNSSVLQTYNYMPSVQGGYDAILVSVKQMTEIGMLKEGTDATAFTENCFTYYDDVPETYTVEEVEAALAE